jgi:hypothetical protein
VTLGRVCQSGYCSPPTWWEGTYKERRQVILRNTSDTAVPKGFPLRLGVGPDPRPFKRDEFTPSARLVAIDRGSGLQVEQPVSVDVVSNNAFDVLYLAPSEIPAGGVLADLYVYSKADGAPSRGDARKQIFPLDDDFEGTNPDAGVGGVLDPATWQTKPVGAGATVRDGDAVILRGQYLWSNLGLPGTPGVQLTVDFQADQSCDGLTMGLIANTQGGYALPYVVVTSSGRGFLVTEALRANQAGADAGLPTEPAAPTPFAITGATQRLDILASGDTVVVSLDAVVVESFVMHGPFTTTDPLRAQFFVDGASCTLSIKKLRMRPALAHEPAVEPQHKVAKPN